MKNFSIIGIAALAMLSISGCPDFSRSAQAQVVDPCEGLPQWGLFVGREPAEEFVARIRAQDDVEAFVQNQPPEGLGIDMDIGELTELVQRIDAEPRTIIDVPEEMLGIAGFSTTLLLKRLLFPNDEPVADQIVYGKIRDYTYVSETKSGHISVDMCIDRREFVPLGEDRREFYHWDIEIPDDQFMVAEREPPSVPSDPATYGNPFPTINFPLPAEAVDPANPASIWRRGLDHKLHAEGREIIVRHVYHRQLSDPNLTRLPDNHHFYTSTDASCIDLFTEGPPPATFGELVDNAYCLGRCEHPGVVNTGG